MSTHDVTRKVLYYNYSEDKVKLNSFKEDLAITIEGNTHLVTLYIPWSELENFVDRISAESLENYYVDSLEGWND